MAGEYAYLDVAVVGDYAYVADWYEGLRIIGVADLASPSEVGFYDTPGSAWGVAAAADYAYVADGNRGLVILRSLVTSASEVYLPLILANQSLYVVAVR